jgi:hypothetical protein
MRQYIHHLLFHMRWNSLGPPETLVLLLLHHKLMSDCCIMTDKVYLLARVFELFP